MIMAGTVDHVVVDSGAFIKNAPIKDIGRIIYTIPDVVSEIRDKATRQRLKVLPYDLKFVEPSHKSLRTVTEFTKKTGDYPSLSATDIKLIALTYQLEAEQVGTDHIKTVPEKKVEIKVGGGVPGTEIAGFYGGDSGKEKSANLKPDVKIANSEKCIADEKDLDSNGVSEEIGDGVSSLDIGEKVADQHDNKQSRQLPNDGDLVSEAAITYDSSEEESEDDSDDDDGWITPKNIDAINQSLNGVEGTDLSGCKVGCLTTDFAMQNVLIQMNLHVISVDGMLIKRARSHVLRCYACFKITTHMEKQFCFHCGNNTLRKLAVAINEHGTLQYFLSRRAPRIYKQPAIPLPKGGKYSNYPKLTEDQRLPQRRQAKQKHQHYGVFDPDFVANASPFALRDTTSRSAQLGVGRNFNKRDNGAGGRRRRK